MPPDDDNGEWLTIQVDTKFMFEYFYRSALSGSAEDSLRECCVDIRWYSRTSVGEGRLLIITSQVPDKILIKCMEGRDWIRSGEERIFVLCQGKK